MTRPGRPIRARRRRPHRPRNLRPTGVTPAIVAEVIALVALAAGAMWLFAFRPLRRRRFAPWPRTHGSPVASSTCSGRRLRTGRPGRTCPERVPELAAGPWAPRADGSRARARAVDRIPRMTVTDRQPVRRGPIRARRQHLKSRTGLIAEDNAAHHRRWSRAPNQEQENRQSPRESVCLRQLIGTMDGDGSYSGDTRMPRSSSAYLLRSVRLGHAACVVRAKRSHDQKIRRAASSGLLRLRRGPLRNRRRLPDGEGRRGQSPAARTFVCRVHRGGEARASVPTRSSAYPGPDTRPDAGTVVVRSHRPLAGRSVAHVRAEHRPDVAAESRRRRGSRLLPLRRRRPRTSDSPAPPAGAASTATSSARSHT